MEKNTPHVVTVSMIVIVAVAMAMMTMRVRMVLRGVSVIYKAVRRSKGALGVVWTE